MHFEVAVGEYLPFLRLSVLRGNVSMTGPLAEAFHELSMRLNFTYTLHKVKGNSWGMHGPNGWTGMLGMIERKEVDMAVGPFTLTYDRWSSFKLSVPVYVDNVEILVPPSQWKMTLFNAVSTFSTSVWLSLLLFVISLSFLITAIDKFQQKDMNFSLRFFHNLWILMKMLLLKVSGRRERPNDHVQTFLSMMWMFSAVVVTSIFSGVFVTKLFIRKIQKIDSIEDLIAATNIQPILENHSSVFGMFKNSQVEVYQTIFQRVISNPDKGILTYENMSSIGMEYVLSGSAAMITDGMGLRGFMVHRHDTDLPCNYWLSQEIVVTMWKVIAFSKSFPDTWLMKINKDLRHTFESGWLQRRMERELIKYKECISPILSDRISLGLEHTKGIFLIWSFGCVAAFLVLTIEYLTVHRPQIFCNTKTIENREEFLVGKASHIYEEVGTFSETNVCIKRRRFN